MNNKPRIASVPHFLIPRSFSWLTARCRVVGPSLTSSELSRFLLADLFLMLSHLLVIADIVSVLSAPTFLALALISRFGSLRSVVASSLSYFLHRWRVYSWPSAEEAIA